MTDIQQRQSRQRHKRRSRLITANAYLMLRKGKRFLPPVVRGALGVLLVLLGIVGFLPILGFWMIPLGLALIATDVPPFYRWLRQRMSVSRKKNHRRD